MMGVDIGVNMHQVTVAPARPSPARFAAAGFCVLGRTP